MEKRKRGRPPKLVGANIPVTIENSSPKGNPNDPQTLKAKIGLHGEAKKRKITTPLCGEAKTASTSRFYEADTAVCSARECLGHQLRVLNARYMEIQEFTCILIDQMRAIGTLSEHVELGPLMSAPKMISEETPLLTYVVQGYLDALTMLRSLAWRFYVIVSKQPTISGYQEPVLCAVGNTLYYHSVDEFDTGDPALTDWLFNEIPHLKKGLRLDLSEYAEFSIKLMELIYKLKAEDKKKVTIVDDYAKLVNAFTPDTSATNGVSNNPILAAKELTEILAKVNLKVGNFLTVVDELFRLEEI